jgi:DNA-binding response OmpR family regulator
VRLLLVEDDNLLGDGICTGLTQAGYTVDWFQNGVQAEAALNSDDFDLVVLDLNLPGLSGLEILQHIRKRGDDTPVLVLTARDTVDDRVRGLDAGADDYLVKPFDLDELNARLRALLRRSKGRSAPRLVHDGIVLDPAAHTVEFHDVPIDLSPKEFSLLQLLLENIGKVLSRHKLEQALYGWQQDVDSNAVEVHIHHLRKKLDSNLIRTVRGVGYVIDRIAP